MILLQLIYSGIALGMIYAVIAFGYQLTFATSGTLNFGQGEALMLGALVGLTLVGLGVNYWVMIPIVCIFGFAQGALVERVGVRPAIKTRSEFGWIMATIALGIIFKNVAENIWGRDDLRFPSPLPEAPIQVLGHDREEVRARALANLAKVRLSGKEDHYPGELSGGQQQRVAIARALAMQPEIILFDEVTAALDPETVKDVLTAIRDLVEDGLTCILVTHEMRFAREVADRVCFTDRGLIVESAPPAELFDSPKEERTREFLAQIL